MTSNSNMATPRTRRMSRGRWPVLAVTAVAVAASSCGSSGSQLPTPRPLVIHSGARITADRATLREVDDWIRDQLTAIEEDPSFLVLSVIVDAESYPWEGLEIVGDTVKYRIEQTATDASTSYQIYAHLRLMRTMGRLDEWIPSASGASDFVVERAITSRMADSWLYGRAVFDAQPYRPLDEVIYAREGGWLDAYILTAQADRFPEERTRWLEESPGAEQEYVEWFEETFGLEPPGMREPEAAPAEEVGDPPPDTTLTFR